MLSANVDFNHSEFDFIQLSGAWARERHIVRTPLRSGGQCVEVEEGLVAMLKIHLWLW